MTVSHFPDGILLDDCADFSVAYAHSDGIYVDVTTEENQYAFDDYTMFMRSEATQEWVEYEIPKNQYLIFHTYFRQNEDISHFTFSWSMDGENWNSVQPAIEICTVEEWRWIPVFYTLKTVDRTAKFIRITFENTTGTAWSPSIAGVYSKYQSDNDPGFADCIDTPYYAATSMLKNLGLVSGYNNYEYQPENMITRAEFAKMTASVLNLQTLSGTEEKQLFYDLPKSHWAAASVSALHGLGVVHGDENGYFHPDDPVTGQEALKILVSALGYTIAAQDIGGYPNGFWQMAVRLNLLENVSLNQTQNLNRGIAALLFVNTLQSEMMYQTEFGGEENEFKKDGTTALNYYHHIYEIKGVLTDVGPASIVSQRMLQNGTAAVDGQAFRMGDFPLKNLLGHRIIAYIRYENNLEIGTILYAEAENGEVTIDLTPEQFLGVQDNMVLYTDQNQNILRQSCSSNTRVIYNGRYDTRIGTAKPIELISGNMQLVRYAGSRSIDVILIYDYQTYRMAASGRLGSVLTDYDLGAVSLQVENAEDIELYCYGEKTAYTPEVTVQKDDVVQLAASRDGKVCRIQIFQDRITGILNGFRESEGTITLNGEEIHLSKNFDVTRLPDLLGKTITVYYDINHFAAFLETDMGTSQGYGYLQAIAPLDTFADEVLLRVLTEEGNWETLTANGQTRLNGKKGSVSEFAVLAPQLIRFKAKEDKTLSYIETASEQNGKVGQEGFCLTYSTENGKYYGDQLRVIDSVYQLSSDAKIFFIPENKAELKDYKVGIFSDLITDRNYRIALYDAGKDYVIKAAVVDAGGSQMRQLENYDPVAIVESSANILDSEGRLCLDVQAWVNGEITHVYFDAEGGEDVTGSWIPGYVPRITTNGNNPFQPGEVFQYYMDDASHCKYFRMLLTQNSLMENVFYESHLGDYGALTEQSYFSELYSMYGTVHEKYANKILAQSDGKGYLRTFSLDGAMVYRFETDRKKLSVADASDIAPGSKIFVRMNFTAVKEMIVIE